MANPTDKGYFVELNHFSILLARCSSLRSPLAIEDLREVPLDNKAGVEEAVQAIFPETKSGTANVFASLRPKQHGFYLSSADEGKKFASLATLSGVLTEPSVASLSPCEYTAVYARDGLTISGQGSPWILAAAAKESYTQALSALEEVKLVPARISPATLSAIGGLASALKLKGDGSTALLFEFGEVCTHLLLVSADGVEAIRSTAVTMDKVAEAVQVELGLKFKGSAAKLFFNESYDFSETGAKIGARIAQELTADIGALGHMPAAFACTGLPAKQNWFAGHLAGALNLAPFAPDLKSWCAQAGLTFSDSAIEPSLTPAWLGFLHFIGSYQVASPEKSVWQPDWTRTAPPPAAAAAPAAVIAPPKPTPAAVISPPKPTPAAVISPPKPAGTVPPPAARPAPPLFTPTPPKSAGTVPPPAARPAPPLFTPTPPKPAGTMPPPAAKPAPPLFTPTPPKPVTPAAASLPVKPGAPAPAKPAAPPAKPIAAPPPRPIAAPPPRPIVTPPKPAAPPPAPAKPAPVAPKPVAPTPAKPVAVPSSLSAKPSFIKSTAGMASMAVAALVLIAVVYFVYSSHQASVKAAAEQIQKQHDAEEAAKKQLADQQAQAAAEFKKAQEEAAAKLAAVEAQAKAAEERARVEEAAHIAAARGQVNIATDPTGATIAIGSLPPRTSPALFTNLKIGNYPVTISLPNYEPVKLNIEVRENETADPGMIKMARQSGSLQLTSEPAGASYSVRSASDMLLLNTSGLSGTTPATLNDLPTGDYIVTFSREGFQTHSETVTVTHDTPAEASWKFVNGNVLVTSTPSGATVTTNDGRVLGITPVTINDVMPGDVSYVLTLDGYDPTTASGKIEGGKTNTIDATLLSVNRLAKLTELDAQPQPIDQPQPQISSRITDSGVVEIDFTVDRSGNVKDLEVVKNTTNNPDVARLCLAAVAKWKYKPGLIDDKPVNVRETVPFTINP
jgi:TonB family protein